MENLFDIISKGLPKPTAEQQQQLQALEQQAVPQAKPAEASSLPLKDLVLRWQTSPQEGDEAVMLKQLKPTISSAITSYAPGKEKELSIQAAKLALNALKSYDPSYGTDPKTHVFNNLKRLSRINGQRANIIPVSEGMSAEQRMLQRLSADFEDDFGREPSLEELADRSGFSIRKVEKLLDANVVVNDSSQVSEESHNSTFFTKDITDEDYFDYVYKSVGPIDQKIMEWASGFHGKPQLPNQVIAQKLGITPAAVSQRKNRIQSLMSEVRGLL